jgi:DNA-binding NarL/FixJ family response regulator
VLIEPRALVRECVARCIGAVPGHFVTSFSSVESWLEVRERTQASLVVLCLPGPLADEQGGFEQLARAAEALPTVVMSDAEDLNSVLDAINRGARGFIPTSLPMEVVIEALRLVRAGGVFVPASSLIPALRTRDTRTSAGGERNTIFTVRQAAVVDALRRGKANKTIAHELNMRESTVKVHVRNIMKKLSAKNRTEVALMTSRLMLEPARAG